MNISLNYKKTLKPAQIIILSFLSVIAIGTIVLMLPISTQSGTSPGFIDALFTATSAVCVTGLVVVDTGTFWSVFGKTIILILIQIGGLGLMTLTTTVAILLGKKIGLRNRILMQEAFNQFSISGVIRLTKFVFILTLVIETIGAILLSFRFIPEMGIKNGIFYSIFHSVSAFCNAGFDIMGNGVSLTKYVSDPLVSYTVVGLVVIGGLGFAVIVDLLRTQKYRMLTLHARLVLKVTFILLIASFILFFLFEYNNPATIGNMSFMDKITAMVFQSVTPRTAGFNSVDMASLTNPSKLLTMLLMFIGGSPGSTAGGVKTTTMGMMFLTVYAVARGVEDVEFSKRRISRQTLNKALAVIFVSATVVFTMFLLLTVTESTLGVEEVLFETLSAFGTVGLSLGITSKLTVAGRIIITVLMFFGRLGPLTIVLALSSPTHNKKQLIRYPEGKIIVG